MKEGAVEGQTPYLHPTPTAPRDVAIRRWVFVAPVFNSLPDEVEQLLELRWPDYLGYESIMHSGECYTIVLLDTDYLHYTFRMVKSLDDRWSLVPISGFEDNERLTEWEAGNQ